MINRFIILFVLCLLLASCAPQNASAISDTPLPAAVPSESHLATATPLSIPSATMSVPSQTPLSVSPQPTALPSGAPLMTGPQDWYAAEMDVDNLHAQVFTRLDPQEAPLASMQDFAAVALVTLPLPAGSDPAALQAGLVSNLDSYTSDDLEGMLLPAQQIGLIDLGAAEEVVLSQVALDTLAGLPALWMKGIVRFQEESLQAQVWLCWTQERFVAYYQFAENENWQAHAASFDSARNSIHFP